MSVCRGVRRRETGPQRSAVNRHEDRLETLPQKATRGPFGVRMQASSPEL
jgi:hypothetical protein